MKPRVGISQCLLGYDVRHDGGNKRDENVLYLNKYFEWVPVCPEVEIGLGIPRESIELVKTSQGIRLLGVTTRTDHTEKMRAYAEQKVKELDVQGFILKSKSPSCGLVNVKIHNERGEVIDYGTGLFSHALPDVPVIEETNLKDPVQREKFIHDVLKARF
jgi:uncharacterized protein YbbK (DUF523 family)